MPACRASPIWQELSVLAGVLQERLISRSRFSTSVSMHFHGLDVHLSDYYGIASGMAPTV
jgi:hypothetical protein